MRKQFRDLASLDEAMAVLEELAIEPRAASVPLEEAAGRVLADHLVAPMDVPGFDRSIMDGYAVVADDTVGAYDDDPVVLELTGKVVPGEEPDTEVHPGGAAEIATGAVIPPGATAVVKVEDTTPDDGAVAVHRPVAPQDNVMGRGADIAAGETVLRRGDRLDARRIGLLAALGIDEVPVARRPTVGLISTGSEIVRPDAADRLGPGEIFDINSFSMAAAIEEAGASPTIYPHAEDDYTVIRDTFVSAADECDLVVSSGSTSASAEDVVYRVVEDAGELLLHGIAVKPGKPTVFGRIGETPVLGMPGNPISALMNFRLFVRPMLRWALDERASTVGTVEATVATDMDSVGGRTQLSPVGLVEDAAHGLLAYPVDKGSGAITSLADADGYLTIPSDVHYVAAGETTGVTLLDPDVTAPDALVCGEACPVIDRAIDATDADVRWLAQGGIDGLRKLRDGIADLAAVGVPADDVAGFDLDGIDRRRGYERRVGYLTADGAAPTDGDTVATLPRQSGLARHLEQVTLAAGTDVDIRHRPSSPGLIRAVEAGEVDAAFVLEASADDRTGGLSFVPVAWTAVDLYIAERRRDKPGVVAVTEAISSVLEVDSPGIRRPDDIGEPLPLP